MFYYNDDITFLESLSRLLKIHEGNSFMNFYYVSYSKTKSKVPMTFNTLYLDHFINKIDILYSRLH